MPQAIVKSLMGSSLPFTCRQICRESSCRLCTDPPQTPIPALSPEQSCLLLPLACSPQLRAGLHYTLWFFAPCPVHPPSRW